MLVVLITPTDASETATLTQKIKATNPVSAVSTLEVLSHEPGGLNPTMYTVVQPTTYAERDELLVDRPTLHPVISFRGITAFPNTKILLEIASDDPHIALVESDSYGNWQWSNFGNPLAAGDHTISVFVLQPTEAENAANVYMEKYYFEVQHQPDITQPDVFSLGMFTSRVTETDWQAATEQFSSDTATTTLFDFEAELINPPLRYQAQQWVDLEMTITPLVYAGVMPTTFEYALYIEEDVCTSQPLFASSDLLDLDGSYRLSKSFELGSDISPGKYALSITASSEDKDYVVNIPIIINPALLATYNGQVFEVNETARFIVWNIIGFFSFTIIIFAFVIYEYRRFFVHQPLDEQQLREKGYFK